MLNSPCGGGLLPSLQLHKRLSLGQSQGCTITNNVHRLPQASNDGYQKTGLNH